MLAIAAARTSAASLLKQWTGLGADGSTTTGLRCCRTAEFRLGPVSDVRCVRCVPPVSSSPKKNPEKSKRLETRRIHPRSPSNLVLDRSQFTTQSEVFPSEMMEAKKPLPNNAPPSFTESDSMLWRMRTWARERLPKQRSVSRKGRTAVCTLHEGLLCVCVQCRCLPLPSKDRDVADRFTSREKTKSSKRHTQKPVFLLAWRS